MKKTLQVLRDRKLYEKFCKYEFWLERVTFFGQIVSREGIEVDSSKVESVKDWTMPKSVVESVKEWKGPKSVMEVRRFLGLVGSYRKFIKGFSTIAVPLTSLTKKNAKFV
ncbi:uncharacterized mitochondrial protein AtMg00860-like [Primulina eburnea]|uniref:uncharacterized mitochondrial protein AtMg00860-like n=1 Tax=Primulina eburnea TaxID=1245227 RepID=UPI003C6C0BE7